MTGSIILVDDAQSPGQPDQGAAALGGTLRHGQRVATRIDRFLRATGNNP